MRLSPAVLALVVPAAMTMALIASIFSPVRGTCSEDVGRRLRGAEVGEYRSRLSAERLDGGASAICVSSSERLPTAANRCRSADGCTRCRAGGGWHASIPVPHGQQNQKNDQ